MLDEKEREKIALKKFSLIAPALNDQTENQKEYFKKLAAEPVDMPHYGPRRYTVKTFEWWLYLYRRHGLEGLKPGYRSDRGNSRRITEEIALKIQEKKAAKPKLSGILLYEELVKDGVFIPDKLSPATFYRFLARNQELVNNHDAGTEEKEMKRSILMIQLSPCSATRKVAKLVITPAITVGLHIRPKLLLCRKAPNF